HRAPWKNPAPWKEGARFHLSHYRYPQDRLKEAAKHGFSLAIVPSANLSRQQHDGLKVIGVHRLDEALAHL
ncbi:MAG: hypothetical protein R6X06_07020, partial [Gammaproteobacteria bacterium]